MHRLVILSVLIPALSVLALGGQPAAPAEPTSQGITLGPGLRLGRARPVPAEFRGPERAVRALRAREAKPLAMAAADFDEDGVPDIVCGYKLGKAGLITLHRGNVDAIYPNAPEAKERRAKGTFVDAPFLPEASAYETPGRPDFLGAGDFDADGHWDVVTAARGKAVLRWHRGDGHGGFGPGEPIDLPGAPTALATGEINRADGLDDLVVGVDGREGPEVLVFEAPEGALGRAPERLRLPAPASSFALGQLDGDHPRELLAAAGDTLVLVHGRDRKLSVAIPGEADASGPAVESFRLPFRVMSMALGSFIAWDGPDVALQDESGALRAASLRTLLPAAREGRPVAGLLGEPLSIEAPESRVMRSNISGLPGDELLLIAPRAHALRVVQPDRPRQKRPEEAEPAAPSAPEPFSRRVPVELPATPEDPVAILAMRLNVDALEDLVILDAGGPSPLSVTSTEPLETVVVTNANPDGPGSFQEAALALDNAGGGLMTFDIPGVGPHVILQPSGTVGLRGSVTLDATTQPGYLGVPVIVLDGSESGHVRDGIYLENSDAVIRGFSIINQPFSGIDFSEFEDLAGATYIEGNYIGLDAGGATHGNRWGIRLHGLQPDEPYDGDDVLVVIGGTTAAARNVIAGNFEGDIAELAGAHPIHRMRVTGNYIGTNPSGTAASAAVSGGIVLYAHDRIVGGAAAGAGNLISGTETGVRVLGDYPEGIPVLIQGNRFGTDTTGLVSIGNDDGVVVEVGASHMIGGTTPAARNIFGGKFGSVGIRLMPGASSTVVQGNYIGLGADGSTSIGNEVGVQVEGGSGHLIGGTVAGARNVISGNSFLGIQIMDGAELNTVAGNYVGPCASGLTACPNEAGGIRLTTDALTNVIGLPGGTNVISGNGHQGLNLLNDVGGNVITNNFIGVAADGTSPLGNTGQGIVVFSSEGNVLGGLIAANQNIIAHNGATGIAVTFGSSGNTLLINSLYENGLLGIDLEQDGVTPNDPLDADTGPQGLQNFPVITLAQTDGGTTRVDGTLDSLPSSTFTIRVFVSPSCDPSGHGEGKYFLGSFTVDTDASGAASFSQTFSLAANWNEAVTATANHLGDTSEFSACKAVVGVAPGVVDHVRFDSARPENLVWDAEPGAGLYNLYIGTLATQPDLVSPISDSCQAASIPGTGGILPPGSNPPPGQMIWFLVTAANQFGEGALEPASQGPRTLNSTGFCGESCAHDACNAGGPLVPACTVCASIVCSKDPHCCSPQGAWDLSCIQQVRTVCRSLACGESQGQCPHGLCNPGGGPLTPGCDTPPLAVSCTAAVCQADPHCCQQAWDESCIAKMESICGYSCL